jgi:hypothetical protein
VSCEALQPAGVTGGLVGLSVTVTVTCDGELAESVSAGPLAGWVSAGVLETASEPGALDPPPAPVLLPGVALLQPASSSPAIALVQTTRTPRRIVYIDVSFAR